MIGGNTEAMLQKIQGTETNHIGEQIQSWVNVRAMKGWLDLSTGDARYTYNAKLQESTHIFITDYVPIDQRPHDKRMVINGLVYEVLMIDDPMGLHQQLEISLKFVG